MKITRVECHVLLVPDYDAQACSSAQDDLVVQIHTDEGLIGIGETDTNPWVARACIETPGTHCMGLGLAEMLIGEDPSDPQRLWKKLYSGSKMTGRRGAVICAMGAIDMALWDLKGKALKKPVHELLGGAVKDFITPYASLLPTGHTLADYRNSLVTKAKQAKAFGFTAGKMEVCINGPYSHNNIQAGDDKIVEIVAACREAVGPDFVMMVDVAYCWPNAKQALNVIKKLEPYDIFFVETPIDIDDLDGYAYLHEHSPIRIAAGEWQNTHWEFLDLADRGKLDVLQPDVGRVGGFTEAVKVTQIAADRNRLIVPHCWKSGIGIAATAHLCATTDTCPFIEFLPSELSESRLRKELVKDELRLNHNGKIALPSRPGLGIELNMDALRHFERHAERK
ncbi:MAG: mandelate racemase/muconate lactonizing enzyme family protein [Phycisphaerales bacterium]|jgi:L-alanine-DL-glutamate epimerase-like enolase superfamily enzyme|nr:mandelate racemase/muconate lactonizing enzyme family protein [Phycisphaerales bacterium]